MAEPVTTISPLAQKFERLQKANKALSEAEQAELRAKQHTGVCHNEVYYAQKDYNAELARTRSVDAMRKA